MPSPSSTLRCMEGKCLSLAAAAFVIIPPTFNGQTTAAAALILFPPPRPPRQFKFVVIVAIQLLG